MSVAQIGDCTSNLKNHKQENHKVPFFVSGLNYDTWQSMIVYVYLLPFHYVSCFLLQSAFCIMRPVIFY